jgi:hypothetical protein
MRKKRRIPFVRRWPEAIIPYTVDEALEGTPTKTVFGAMKGKFHDQGDAKWIVIKGQSRGHNNMPFGQPTPGWLIGRPGVGHPSGIFGVFNCY